MPQTPADQNIVFGAIGSSECPGLSKMTEECGELLQVIGKIHGLGHMGQHWDGSDLRKLLMKEMGDVLASVIFFCTVNKLELEEVDNRAAEKMKLFCRWQDNVSAGREPYTDADGVRRVPGHLWEPEGNA